VTPNGGIRAVVTGTSGFIGRHLAEALTDRGHSVLGFDRRDPATAPRGYEHRAVDLLDAERVRRALREWQPDVVLHLAARTDMDEHRDLRAYAANIDGVRNLVTAIQDTPSVRRWICTSTQLICRVGYRPTHDRDYCPDSLYGQSKVETEEICRAADGGGVTWTIVRPTTIWGPGMKPHYVRFFRMVRQGRYFHVGRRPLLKTYGYVGNTVHQFMRLLIAPAEQVHRRTFYLADYEPLSLQEWAEEFRQQLGAPPIRTIPLALAAGAAHVGDLLNAVGLRDFPFNSFRLNNIMTPYQMDTGATREVCGPVPWTMRDGVTATVSWLRTLWGEPAPAAAAAHLTPRADPASER
jgi:GlcNAc-P-P-Und epimerase